jgi:hypothetical protein
MGTARREAAAEWTRADPGLWRLRDSARSGGCGVECVGVLAAIVLGQDGTRLAGPACDGALADLAADDRKTRDGDGETAGI